MIFDILSSGKLSWANFEGEMVIPTECIDNSLTKVEATTSQDFFEKLLFRINRFRGLTHDHYSAVIQKMHTIKLYKLVYIKNFALISDN